MSVLYSKIVDAYGDVYPSKISDDVKENTKEKITFPFATGYIPDQPDSRDYKLSSISDKTLKNKNVVDYTSEMSPVKNQARKGACVGFAVAAMVEWQQQQEYLKEKKKGSAYTRDKDHYNLSEQWIYHKAQEIDGFDDGTEGTTIRAAMKILNKQGVPTESGWEYDDSAVNKPEFWAKPTARWNKSKSYYKIESIREMKETLQKIGPFVAGVLVYDTWSNPTNSGYVSFPNDIYNYLGAHAICIVGYNEDKKRFKFKNSWGRSWGNNGYGWLSYRYMKELSIISWVSIDDDIKSI